MIFIQPKSDSFCTVKIKRKCIDRKRKVIKTWLSCSKCGCGFSQTIETDIDKKLKDVPAKCPRCGRSVLYWT